MGLLATLAALGVGAVLIVAGVFKLVDVRTWSAQAADMGVARPIAVVVPWLELLLGVLLVVPVLRPWPALATVALLLAFTGVIIARLRDGSRPPCACFGPRSDRPLGPLHVVRNAILVALAVVAALGS